MMSILTPASEGVQGPGEMSTRSGFSFSASAGVISLLRKDSHVHAQLAEVLDQVEGERIVVVDDEEHFRIP
jgi:hypothetical protein